jgi:hypothetical protein
MCVWPAGSGRARPWAAFAVRRDASELPLTLIAGAGCPKLGGVAERRARGQTM